MDRPILSDSVTTLASLRARRAIGAMFFFAFGGAWLGLWSFTVFHGDASLGAAIVIAAAACALTGFAYYRYRLDRHALAGEVETPARKKTDRMFHMINAGQWILIVILANVLANTGLSTWIIPMAIFVIGLHFLPLARIFENPPHYLTGAALISLAVAYPMLATGGPANPVGCLGAGLILWASAFWAVLATPLRRNG